MTYKIKNNPPEGPTKWALDMLIDTLENHASEADECITEIKIVWYDGDYIAELEYK